MIRERSFKFKKLQLEIYVKKDTVGNGKWRIRSMEEMILAVDFDDTIAASNPAVIAWHNVTYGTQHPVAPGNYHLERLWGISSFEVEKRFSEYVESVAHDKVDPVPHAVPILRDLAQKYRIHLITGRTQEAERRTRVWINAYLPGVFTDLHFTGEFVHSRNIRRTKGQLARALGANVFIEDATHYAVEIAGTSFGTRVILLDTIWNKGFVHPRVERVTSWLDVSKLLETT